MSDLFLSERNLIILTINPNDSIESNSLSIVQRLLKIFIKNTIPVKYFIVSIGDSSDDKYLDKIKDSVVAILDKLEAQLKNQRDLYYNE